MTALAPESNTEQAQQNAAELEQAPHPANCACDECRNAFFDELDSQLDQRITKLRKQIAQADMFAAREEEDDDDLNPAQRRNLWRDASDQYNEQ